MEKNKWLDKAEILDSFRVVPRIIFLIVMCFVVWYTYYVTQWYFTNFKELGDNAAMMYGSSGLLGVTIPALFKFAIDYANKYLDGGVDWSKRDK